MMKIEDIATRNAEEKFEVDPGKLTRFIQRQEPTISEMALRISVVAVPLEMPEGVIQQAFIDDLEKLIHANYNAMNRSSLWGMMDSVLYPCLVVTVYIFVMAFVFFVISQLAKHENYLSLTEDIYSLYRTFLWGFIMAMSLLAIGLMEGLAVMTVTEKPVTSLFNFFKEKTALEKTTNLAKFFQMFETTSEKKSLLIALNAHLLVFKSNLAEMCDNLSSVSILTI